MRRRFDILGRLPIPKDIPLDCLKPIGIPERFTLHEFLLGSASGVSKPECLKSIVHTQPIIQSLKDA